MTLNALPEPLRNMSCFLLWKAEPDAKGKMRKTPYYASGTRRRGRLDTPEDLAQLVSFDEACEALRLGDYAGLGFALTGTGVGAFDLDHILDNDGELLTDHSGYHLVLEARAAGAYIEISPSGQGLRMIGACSIQGAYSVHDTEFWSSGRYVTVTGTVWANPGGWVDLTGLRAALNPHTKPVGAHDGNDEQIITPLILEELKSALEAIDADSRDEWVRMGLALKTLDDKGKALWLEWSATSDKYDEADAHRVWDSLNPSSTGYKAVFAEAQNNWDWQNPRKRDVARAGVRGEVLGPSEISEDAIALAFTARYRDSLRFDFNAGRWFQWNGTRWESDNTALAFHYARQLGRALTDGQRSMCKAAVASGAERFARADPAHATTSTRWDTDRMLLGTPNGTVDLNTGELSPPDPKKMITKLTGVAPEVGEPTLWLKFLREALVGDEDAVTFVQQWFGYCLTGETREHSLAFLYGPGGNGKSVCVNTLVAILGDYAVTSTMDTFTASRFDSHSTDLAMLRGARLVTASETEEGRHWAEARIKQLTGGDPITARFMRQDNFTFRPEFKLTIAGNHAPSLRNVDDAMKRRLIILPFTNKPKSPDLSLEVKLRAEHGKILNWAIEGCLDWLSLGLIRPLSVTKATDEYFNDQDLLAQWLEERCDLGERRNAPPTQLYKSWSEYARVAGDDPGNIKTFVSELQRRGFVPGKSNGTRVYRGLSLRFGQGDV